MGEMSKTAREANPYAQHEAHINMHKTARDELLGQLEKLDATADPDRDERWWAKRDEVGTALRQVEQVIRSAELARTQTEGFAAGMAPVTISADEQPEAVDKSEE